MLNWPLWIRDSREEAPPQQPKSMVPDMEIVRHAQIRRGFVLLSLRWTVERSFPWAARFHRPIRDYGRLAKTLAAFHFRAFACVMLADIFRLRAGSQQHPLTATKSGNFYIA